MDPFWCNGCLFQVISRDSLSADLVAVSFQYDPGLAFSSLSLKSVRTDTAEMGSSDTAVSSASSLLTAPSCCDDVIVEYGDSFVLSFAFVRTFLSIFSSLIG